MERFRNQRNHACQFCNSTFYKEHNLKRHIESVHKKEKSFICPSCSKTFSRNDELRRHVQTHCSTEPENLKCTQCDVSFTTKGNLRRHLNSLRHETLTEIDNFICANCGKRCCRKDVLINHIRRCYRLKPVRDSEYIFECGKCHRTFDRKDAIRTHVKRCMVSTRRKHLDTLKCTLCASTFGLKKDVLNHISRIHPHVRIEREHLRFENEDEFRVWKSRIEKSTITCFHQRTVKRLSGRTLRSYLCHRSGTYRPKRDRARRLKVQGSKKINGYCPAEMKLSTNEVDGVCLVSYTKTHLGHNVGDVHELVHINLSKEERYSIASQIWTGAPYGKILDDSSAFNAGDVVDRLSLLCNKDLHNIAATFGLKYRAANAAADLSNAETFISQNADRVLYYKAPYRLDSKYETLLKDDLIVVLMSPAQRVLIERYGHKAVAMDGTRRAREDNFCVHVILVIDDGDEALVVAIAVTNKNHVRFIDVFLTSVKETIGSWRPTIFMSDSHGCYPDSWSRVMGEPSYSFRCVWHVRETWQKSLCKIANGEKRAQMQDLLYGLLSLSNEIEFRTVLETLATNSDPDLRKFVDYFRKYYYRNPQQWAYCYRRRAGEEANAYFESFSRTCKYVNVLRTKAKCLSSCLYLLKKYTTSEERELELKLLKPKYSCKLRKLRQRHDEIAAKNLETIVLENDSDQSWLVSVSGSDEEGSLYFVNAANRVCDNCEYCCEICEACFHTYQCSCLDFTIKQNMCKHVHGLCMYLKGVKERHLENEANSGQQNNTDETWTLAREPKTIKEEILDAYNDSADENEKCDRLKLSIKEDIGTDEDEAVKEEVKVRALMCRETSSKSVGLEKWMISCIKVVEVPEEAGDTFR